MTVQNALEEMKERAFAPAFQKYLFDTYKVLAQTDFSEEEKCWTNPEYRPALKAYRDAYRSFAS